MLTRGLQDLSQDSEGRIQADVSTGDGNANLYHSSTCGGNQ